MTPVLPSSHGYVLVQSASIACEHDPSSAIIDTLERGGWRIALTSDLGSVLLGPTSRLKIRRLGSSGFLVGDYYSTAADPTLVSETRPSAQIARELVRSGWGRYVAVWPSEDGALNVLRDPSGGLDAVHWRVGGISIVTPDPPDALDPWLPIEAGIDWSLLAAILKAPATGLERSALKGLNPVTPGCLLSVTNRGLRQDVVWKPSDFCQPAKDVEAHADRLRGVVDATVATLTADHPRIIVEISGGFDSAVVASSAADQAPGGLVHALNYYSDGPESDERRYARDLAERWALPLTPTAKPVLQFERAQFEALGLSVRPSLHGLDPAYDRDVARLLGEHDATAILTGQGGDAMFFQFPTPTIVADRVDRLGLANLDLSFVYRLARWTRTTIWKLLGIAVRHRLKRPQAAGLRLDPHRALQHRHSWLVGNEHLPPAKRGQISQLTNCQLFWGDCLRARTGDFLHPLLCQPVVEHCLAIPADVATVGGVDRGLARQAFADRLPRSIRLRRGKGEMSGFYGRSVLASLPLFQNILSDSRLVDQGVISSEKMDALLDADTLIWSGDYNLTLIAVALEMWVHNWERRLATPRHVPTQPMQDALVEQPDVGG